MKAIKHSENESRSIEAGHRQLNFTYLLQIRMYDTDHLIHFKSNLFISKQNKPGKTKTCHSVKGFMIHWTVNLKKTGSYLAETQCHTLKYAAEIILKPQ